MHDELGFLLIKLQRHRPNEDEMNVNTIIKYAFSINDVITLSDGCGGSCNSRSWTWCSVDCTSSKIWTDGCAATHKRIPSSYVTGKRASSAYFELEDSDMTQSVPSWQVHSSYSWSWWSPRLWPISWATILAVKAGRNPGPSTLTPQDKTGSEQMVLM